MHNYLIKFLLLLSASLSLHSSLALPLSSVLASKYHAVTDSIELSEQIHFSTALNDFAAKQAVQSKLQTSLLTLLQQEHNDNLVLTIFIAAVNELNISIVQLNTQTLTQQTYQEQLTTYTHVQGRKNSLYTQMPYYQAKLQRQQSTS